MERDQILLTSISADQLFSEIRAIVQSELSTVPVTSSSERKQFLNLNEAAAFLNLKPQTIYQLTSQKRIPFIKRGKLLFEKAALVKWLHAGTKSFD